MRTYTRRTKVLAIPEHVHPVVKEIWRIAVDQRVTMAEISRRSGVDYSTVMNWRCGPNPSLVNVDAVLGAMGYRLKVVPQHRSPGWE